MTRIINHPQYKLVRIVSTKLSGIHRKVTNAFSTTSYVHQWNSLLVETCICYRHRIFTGIIFWRWTWSLFWLLLLFLVGCWVLGCVCWCGYYVHVHINNESETFVFIYPIFSTHSRSFSSKLHTYYSTNHTLCAAQFLYCIACSHSFIVCLFIFQFQIQTRTYMATYQIWRKAEIPALSRMDHITHGTRSTL